MRENKGIALILVVSVLAVAGIMAVSFAFTMQLELKASTNFLEATRASYLAEAGVTYAQVLLREDARDIDSFEDNWNTVFSGSDVDNDDNGEADSKWIEIYNDLGDTVGRYAVLVRDEASFLDINIATKANTSPLKVTEGWSTYELDLKAFLSSFGLKDPDSLYQDILNFRYGIDGWPGVSGVDDNLNQRVLGSDGIDNNADGVIDEAGEGIDEPMEFNARSTYGDDNSFRTPFDISKIKSISKDALKKITSSITTYSVDANVDIEGRIRENINFMDPLSLTILLEDSGVPESFQKAVNIVDACDDDFAQSVLTKLHKRLTAVNRGKMGNWEWDAGRYKSNVKDGEPLKFTWWNMPEGEYYIGMFGVSDEMVGDVTINGMTQASVKHGEILRFGAITFEGRIMNLEVRNSEEEGVCYFSHLELYPKTGQEGFSTVEIRGIEGIRINEVMIKPRVRKNVASKQDPGGDWKWGGSFFQNDDPGGGRSGEGTWTWTEVRDGQYYVKLFSSSSGQYVGDVEIDGKRSEDLVDGDLFGNGRSVSVTGGKLTVRIQNNRSSGSVYFGGVELSQEPDGEYIEIVNLTPREVNLGGWSVDASGKEGWPASIPLGTVIGSYEHLALCVDRNDSQDGINNNGISFMSIWGKERSAELHFVRSVTPLSDLLANTQTEGGNFIELKDMMGHIVDKVEYFSGDVAEFVSLEKSDPSYVVDSNLNGIPDNWHKSKAEKGGTPGLPNDNDGMEEELPDGEILEHSVNEVKIKNKNFSSIGEIAYIPLSLKEWETIPLDDLSKVADRLTVHGLRLEAEGNIVSGSEGGWRVVQRGFPFTDHFESGTLDSIGMWRWDRDDGLEDGYYTLRIFGGEEEEISVSVHLQDGMWTSFTPPLNPDVDGSILFGNIEIGTNSSISTESGVLELKIKNSSKTASAHFDYIRLDPVNQIYGKININTASEKVLGALPGIDRGVVGSILSNRVYGNKTPLRLGIGDLISSGALGSEDVDKKENFRKIANLVTIRSNLFRIIVTAQMLDEGRVTSEKKIWVVFER